MAAEESSWRTANFRQSVVAKIEEAIRSSGMPTTKNSMEMENHVFQKAKTKEEYLGFVARLILHVREMNSKKSSGIGGPSGAGGQNMPDPINALQTLARQGTGNQMMGLVPPQGPNQVTATNLLQTLNQRPGNQQRMQSPVQKKKMKSCKECINTTFQEIVRAIFEVNQNDEFALSTGIERNLASGSLMEHSNGCRHHHNGLDAELHCKIKQEIFENAESNSRPSLKRQRQLASEREEIASTTQPNNQRILGNNNNQLEIKCDQMEIKIKQEILDDVELNARQNFKRKRQLAPVRGEIASTSTGGNVTINLDPEQNNQRILGIKEMKRRKIKLEMEVMEKRSYERSLIILKLERELGVAPSKYSRELLNNIN